ncbi:hypothetical protein RISK_004589 [Rhodopirellula islandica]|uniref:Uncharacterized protein n=1 Tax=Rhodopirellula islandica TaxID=595434 RepID=A0A0J1B985_RHOIS|nr:hypothetical protein RISK_004589 [Rhodopirellula islandica]
MNIGTTEPPCLFGSAWTISKLQDANVLSWTIHNAGWAECVRIACERLKKFN